MRALLLTAAAAILLAASVSLAPAAPAPTTSTTTRPNGPSAAPGAGASMMLDRAREAVDQLKLSPEQKGKIEKIFKDARTELEQLKTQLESMQPRDRFAEVRDFLEGVRADLTFVLTPEQRQQIQEKFDQLREGPGPGGAGGMPAPGAIAERLREALPKLKLSDEQGRKIREFFDDLRPRADALRQQAESGDAAARAKLRDLGQETREKLREILTPQQQDQLRELMRQPTAAAEARTPGSGRRPRNTLATTRAARGDKSDQMGDTMMSSGDTMTMEGSSAARRGKPAAPAAGDDDSPKASAGPAIGAAAPDFTLNKLDGSQVQLSALKGRVVVLVFGSYSAPSFRKRVPGLEKLRSDFGTRATVFVVYSREAHPTGEWEISRNKDDGISVEQAKTLDARKAAATTARDKLKMTTPILLDTLGNDATLAYGAGVNSAYVIGRDGTIVARQQWFEPNALRRALDAATAATPATPATPAKPATRPAN